MDRPLRVAIFGESFLPYRSGVTVSTDALAKGLAAAGHQVLLVVPRPARGDEASVALAAAGEAIEVAWLPSYQGPPPVPPRYRMPVPRPSRSLRAARDWRPEVVHAQSPFVSGLMARNVARVTGTPLVFTHHTRFGDYRHYLGPLAGPGARLTERYLRSYWAGCAAIVAPSTDLAREITARIRGSRPIVRAIPTGLDLAALAALTTVDPRTLAGWPADSVVVVSVGRLAREKSVDVLTEAFARAATSDPRLRLLLVGDGPLSTVLAERAAMPDLLGRVHLAGSLDRPDALALASGADLFAFASRTETQGLVLTEALAVGLPVVAMDGPGVRDSVRDGVDGVIVPRPPLDAIDETTGRLAEAIAAVAGDPSRRARLAAAAWEGAWRFALADRIEEVVELYREVVARA